MGERRMMVARPLWVALLGALLASPLACNDTPLRYDDDWDCSYDPRNCDSGDLGAYCHSNAECDTGWCCESKECGGGMCTYSCDRDNDCPADMGCEHHTCFFYCHNDNDCAAGQKCEHKRVCEWD